MTLERVKLVVEELRAARAGPEDVADAVELLLEEGLKGNRAVTDNLWSVVTAAVRAFPIQLSPSVEKAQAVVQARPELNLVKTWLVQASADGSLVILLQKLRSQPQILTAYDAKAPIRSPTTTQQLIEVLQELKALIPVTPYDRYLQQQASQEPTAASQPVHIQTEDDLPHHNRHHSSSSCSANQQQQEEQSQGQVQVNRLPQLGNASPAVSSSSSTLDVQETADGGGVVRGGSKQAAAAPRSIGKKLLLGAFSRRSSSSNNTVDSTSAANNAKNTTSSCTQQQQQLLPPSDQAKQSYVKVCLQVVNGASNEQQQQQQLVQLHLEVAASTHNSSSPCGPSSKAAASSSSSSSTLFDAGAGAVKGLLQGLQQSTTNLQQSAAGQDISGAVAAASGAVAAAIGQPFAAVKGYAAAATSRAGGKKVSRRSTSPNKMQSGTAEIAAAADVPSAHRSSLHLPRFFKQKRPGAATSAAGAHSGGSSFSAAEGKQSDFGPYVQLQLTVCQEANAKAHPISCVIMVVTPSELAAHRAGTASSPTGSTAWGPKGLMKRFGSTGRNSKEHQRADKQQQQQGEQAQCMEAEAVAGVSEDSADGDVLEGDMWSVMSRLRNNSTAKAAAAAEEEGPSAASEAAAAQQLSEQGHQLLQQLLESCSHVAAAAAISRGCLGDECQDLLQMIDLLKGLFNHGLEQSSSSSGEAAGKGAAFSGWLSSRTFTAFGVLQALQHGSKQHPRLMLGADSISNMQAAKGASPAAKLDLWVRSSLNEQLLGVRLSTLLANPTAVAQYYQPQALLLQQQEMLELQQQLTELLRCKFALLVEAPIAAASYPTAAGGGSSSSGSVMDPRRLLGGLGKSFGTLRTGSSGSSAVTAAATAGRSLSTTAPAAAAGASSSSAIPTFLWSALGTSSSSNEAAADAAVAGSGSSILKRGQRRLANILEVRVPPPDSASVLSPENSCALSPVSTPGDAAYAEWWSPNSSWQDMQTAATGPASSQGGSQVGSTGEDALVADNMQRSDAEAYYPPGGSRSSSSGSLGSRSVQAAAAAASAGSSDVGRSAAQGTDRDGAMRVSGSGVGSEAAKKLEQELTAAMAAPLQVLLERSRRTGSSGGGAASRSGDLVSGSKSAELLRSSSSGWEAAVANARARSRDRVGTAVGVPCQQPMYSVSLHRRSRSPDAHWPAAGSGYARPSSGDVGGHELERANMRSQAGAGGEVRRARHMHKRSSSLNDLPELAALLESGGVQE